MNLYYVNVLMLTLYHFMNIHTSDTDSILIAQPSEKIAEIVVVISKSNYYRNITTITTTVGTSRSIVPESFVGLDRK